MATYTDILQAYDIDVDRLQDLAARQHIVDMRRRLAQFNLRRHKLQIVFLNHQTHLLIDGERWWMRKVINCVGPLGLLFKAIDWEIGAAPWRSKLEGTEL